jgi:hypothetical protein
MLFAVWIPYSPFAGALSLTPLPVEYFSSRLRTQVQAPEHVTGLQGRNQQIFRVIPARITSESRVG